MGAVDRVKKLQKKAIHLQTNKKPPLALQTENRHPCVCPTVPLAVSTASIVWLIIEQLQSIKLLLAKNKGKC